MTANVDQRSRAVFEFRVTKFDPTLRDADGAYLRDDWTSVNDIDRTFDGVVLTKSEYDRIEDAYVSAATAFLNEAGVQRMTVTGLENHAGVPLRFREGLVLSLAEVESVVRRVLREEFWCRLEAAGGFLRFGHDYYMYIGVRRPCPEAEKTAGRLGLFVEPFRSPLMNAEG